VGLGPIHASLEVADRVGRTAVCSIAHVLGRFAARSSPTRYPLRAFVSSSTLERAPLRTRTRAYGGSELVLRWCRRGDLNPHVLADTSPSIRSGRWQGVATNGNSRGQSRFRAVNAGAASQPAATVCKRRVCTPVCRRDGYGAGRFPPTALVRWLGTGNGSTPASRAHRFASPWISTNVETTSISASGLALSTRVSAAPSKAARQPSAALRRSRVRRRESGAVAATEATLRPPSVHAPPPFKRTTRPLLGSG